MKSDGGIGRVNVSGIIGMKLQWKIRNGITADLRGLYTVRIPLCLLEALRGISGVSQSSPHFTDHIPVGRVHVVAPASV